MLPKFQHFRQPPPSRRIPLPNDHQLEKRIEEDLKNTEKIKIVKEKLMESYAKKSFEINIFFQKAKENISQQSPSSTLVEDQHRQILLQNFRKMIYQGDKLMFMKREATPFKTLILQFEDEEIFQKIQRLTPICSDGISRPSPFLYIQFLLTKSETNIEFIKMMNENSNLFSFTYQEREPDPMLKTQLKQIQDEYPDYYETMKFYQQKDFTPISYFTIFATLKN
jgi:hypothetical protein